MASIAMVKENYLSQVSAEIKAKHGLAVDKLGLISMGKRLEDDMFLYSYNIEDKIVIDVLIKN